MANGSAAVGRGLADLGAGIGKAISRKKKQEEEERRAKERIDNLIRYARSYGRQTLRDPAYEPSEAIVQAITIDADKINAGDVRKMTDAEAQRQRTQADEAAKTEAEPQRMKRLVELPASEAAGMEARSGGISPLERETNIRTMAEGSLAQRQEVLDRAKLPEPEKLDEAMEARKANADRISDPRLRQLYIAGEIQESDIPGFLPEKSKDEGENQFPTNAQLFSIYREVKNETVETPMDPNNPYSSIVRRPKYQTDEEVVLEAMNRVAQSREFRDAVSKDVSSAIEAEQKKIDELEKRIRKLMESLGR